jgi:RNA polymerase sigma-70 factor (ECF subfamily)
MKNPGGPTPLPSENSATSILTGEDLAKSFDAIRDELASTLMYLLGNREDALDCVQETFLKCWRNLDSLQQVSNFRAWIFRVGLNTAKDMRRSAWKRKAKPFLGEEAMLVGRENLPGQLLEEQESLERLREAIRLLRDEEKEVFLLRQNGGFTYEEIAEMRQAPIGTVKTQMRAALMKLRKVLD